MPRSKAERCRSLSDCSFTCWKKVNDRIHSLILLIIVSPILVLPVIHLDDYRRCGVVVEPKRKARVAFVRSFASFFSFNPFTSPSHQTLWILTTGTMTMTMTLTWPLLWTWPWTWPWSNREFENVAWVQFQSLAKFSFSQFLSLLSHPQDLPVQFHVKLFHFFIFQSCRPALVKMCSTPTTSLAAVVRLRAQKWSQWGARSAPTSFLTWWLCDLQPPKPPWGCRPAAASRRPIFTWRLSRGMQLLLFRLLLGLPPPRVLPCSKTLPAPTCLWSSRGEQKAFQACLPSRLHSTRPASSSYTSTFSPVRREASCDKNPNKEFKKLNWTYFLS